jgi:transcriptional antiterminator NusG
MSDTDLTPEELTDSTEPAIDSADAVEEATTDAVMESTTEAVTAEVEEAVEAPEAAVEAIAVVEELADADVASEDELFESDEPVKVESPFDRAGRWYVVHTQSGHEKKAQQNLAARTASMNMEDRIFESVIPMEDVVEFKNGKKVVVQKKMFPGYLLVRAVLDDDAWYVVRNTPSVVNFVGSGGKPSPLMRREVEDFLQVKEEGAPATPNKRSKARLEYEMGETVRVKEGPFADFSGEIVEINEDQLKVKVLVNIFGRETPVELEFSQIARL